jgi:hypothetical protein
MTVRVSLGFMNAGFGLVDRFVRLFGCLAVAALMLSPATRRFRDRLSGFFCGWHCLRSHTRCVRFDWPMPGACRSPNGPADEESLAIRLTPVAALR